MLTTADPTLKRRSLNSSSGSMGWRARCCHLSRTAPNTTAIAKAASTGTDVQPCSGPSMMPYISAVMATMERPAPAGSRRRGRSSRDRGSHSAMTIITTATTGTL